MSRHPLRTAAMGNASRLRVDLSEPFGLAAARGNDQQSGHVIAGTHLFRLEHCAVDHGSAFAARSQPVAGQLMRGVFVTGTDTGIGKTHASVLLLRALRRSGVQAIGMKPVASGCNFTPEGLRNEDALALVHAAGIELPYDDVNPYAFADPIAPHLAAADKGVEINSNCIFEAFERLRRDADVVVVEGVGGWLAPLGGLLMQADLVHALELPVLLVVGLRLGCLNHALLTARAIEADGCQLIGWIGNRIDADMLRAEDNIETLKARIQAPLLGIVEHGGHSRGDVHVDDLDGAVRILLLHTSQEHLISPSRKHHSNTAIPTYPRRNRMAKAQRYFITIEDLSASRSDLSELAFDGGSPEHLAQVFTAVLREPDFWQRWRATQENPDEVDAATGVIDPAATVTGSLEAQRSELIVTTNLPHAIVKHRLDLLIGRHWKLRDVSSP